MPAISLDQIVGSFEVQDGFPRPQWEKIGEWIRAHYRKDDNNEVWTEAARQWLERLKAHLGGGYEVYESDHLLLLSSSGFDNAEVLLGIAESTLSFMLDSLAELVKKTGPGHVVCLSFADSDRYYEYISHFYEEGEYGHSGGVFIDKGYGHCVLNASDQSNLERALVHELSHALLHPRSLPLWLDEGVAQLVEEAVLSQSKFTLTRKDVREHQRYWTKNGLGGFWNGESFHRPDKGQHLSYALAQVIVRNMLSTDRRQFLTFFQTAQADDYGEEESRRVFGLTLGDWAMQFLGEGDWEVISPGVQQLHKRALFRLSQGAYDRALADYRKAVEQDSEAPALLQELAWLLSTCPNDDIRDGDEALAIARRVCKLTNWQSGEALDVLAAAYARCGDFDRAVQFAEQARARAPEGKTQDIAARLRNYREGIPYIDVPPELG